jgi:hypothetical protein
MSAINNVLYNGLPISNSNISTTINSTNVITSKHTYNVLGDSLDIDGYADINIAIIITNINLNGETFYRELKKQGVSLPSILEEFLENKFLIINRDKKIDGIITNKS